MFSISGISVYFPGRELLGNISFIINARDRIGLVGKNGAGKSTLMKLISGLQKADTGSILIPEGKSVAYLPQELVISSEKTVIEEAMTAFSAINELESSIEKLNDEIALRTDYESDDYLHLFNLLNEKHEHYKHLEGSKKEGHLVKILKGLGFTENDLERKMHEFSQGWQMRVELAKIILRKPELILLDEPTNHLDIESILWLEDFLSNYNGAIMMVSHDRMFLDNICNRTIEIINARIYDYALPYSDFLLLREERLESQFAAARNQQRYIEQQERFIERFRAKNTKAKQVQSKIRKLEKLDKVEFDEEDQRNIEFSFPKAPRSGSTVVESKDVSKSYGQLKVLKNISFHIGRGERIAFVGRNGEGKTSMIKMIMGECEHEGELITGYNVHIGYYAQVQEKKLDSNDSVYQAIDREATGDWSNISRLRALLGAFLFTEDDTGKKVKVLSGGEKSRLALAKLLLKPANILILDEPTNHLDFNSKEVLKKALQKFEGTLILVSHDRSFLQGLTNRTFEFRNSKIKEHPGDIDAFLRHHKVESFRDFEKAKTTKTIAAKDIKEAEDKKGNYQQRREIEKQNRKLGSKIKKLEQKVEEKEALLNELEGKMQTKDFFNDPENAKKISQLHQETREIIKVTVDEWGILQQQAEALKEERSKENL